MARCLQQCWERAEQRKNFLHPDTAAVPTPPASSISPYSRYYKLLECTLYPSNVTLLLINKQQDKYNIKQE